MIQLVWVAFLSAGISLGLYISAWALSLGSYKNDFDMKWLIPAIREMAHRFMLLGGLAAAFATILRLLGGE